MRKRSKADWREFEELITSLQRGFYPGARITTNDHIPGQNSGVLREIDICIRHTLGLQELLIVVDCKKRSRVLDVTGMEGFVGLKKDVGANAGVIVNEKGFSKGALRLAKREGIQALTFHDTRGGGWEKRLRIPLVLDLRILMPRRASFQRDGEDEKTIQATEEFEEVRRGLTSPKRLIEDYWFRGPEMESGGWKTSYHGLIDKEGHAGVLRMYFLIEKRRYLNKVSPEFVGFIDRQNEVAHLNSFDSPEISLSDIDTTWERLDCLAPVPQGMPILMVKTIVLGMREGTVVVPKFPTKSFWLAVKMAPETPLPVSIKPEVWRQKH
jgi:hypothetical protein